MDAFAAEQLTIDALRERGVLVSADEGSHDRGWDFRIDPGATLVDVKYRALVDLDAARRLVSDHRSRGREQGSSSQAGPVLLAVGDRITEEARRLLDDHGAGYYDLRGHIAFRSKHVLIDLEVKPHVLRSESTDPFAGKAGLEVATALLMQPTSGPGVRQLARQLGRAPSTASQLVRWFTREGYLDDRLRVVDTRLFWHVAERWDRPRTYLLTEPPRDSESYLHAPLRMGLDDPAESTGWALTDSMAAVAYGAPLAVRGGQPSDFYVPDMASLQRAERLLGSTANPSESISTVRVAPVPTVCSRRVVAGRPWATKWPLAHPIFVALDLAQDAGRGREILESWSPDPRWQRVW